jgi:RNA 2',3'-cyclic 3'-phosphodiesterase
MPRLFTGLALPADVTSRLSMLKAGLNGARWIDPENYHITIRFVGDISETQAADLAHALSEISFESFEIELNGLGSFGGDKPRAIWAGVAASPQLTVLHKAHERAARFAGLAPEPRNYVPHVTLARLRNVSSFVVADYLSAYGGFRCPPFCIDRFVLYSSKPGQGGGPYLVEETYPALDSSPDGEPAFISEFE